MKDEILHTESGTFIFNNSTLMQYSGDSESVRVPGFIYSIGSKAFENSQVKHICLSSNVKKISENAFVNCRALETVELPYSLEEIGSLAFQNCDRLSELIFSGNKANWFAIKKGERWLHGSENLVIKCLDGIITKEEQIEVDSEPNASIVLNDDKLETSVNTSGSPNYKSAYENICDFIEDDDFGFEDKDDEDNLYCPYSKYTEDELRYKALKVCILEGRASVPLLQKHLNIGYSRACRLLQWMRDEKYAFPRWTSKASLCIMTITLAQLEGRFGCEKAQEGVNDQGNEDDLIKKLLDTSKRKRAEQGLVNVLTRIAEKKRDDFSIDKVPSHSLWESEDEFHDMVLERLDRLISSDFTMGRKGAVIKAKAYLTAVLDTHDVKMLQVYQRVYFEVATVSDYLYVKVRNTLRDAK